MTLPTLEAAARSAEVWAAVMPRPATPKDYLAMCPPVAKTEVENIDKAFFERDGQST